MRYRIKNIHTGCALFASKYCRTKTGWPHQRWCDIADKTMTDCDDCVYYKINKKECKHPILKEKSVMRYEQ